MGSTTNPCTGAVECFLAARARRPSRHSISHSSTCPITPIMPSNIVDKPRSNSCKQSTTSSSSSNNNTMPVSRVYKVCSNKIWFNIIIINNNNNNNNRGISIGQLG